MIEFELGVVVSRIIINNNNNNMDKGVMKIINSYFFLYK